MSAITFHHVEAYAGIAEVVEQELLVSDDVLLHLRVGVVEVAASVEVVACVIGASSRIATTIALVSATDVSRRVPRQRVTVLRLIGEVGPVGGTVLVVDNNIGDDARTLRLEGADHVAQLGFRTEIGVLLKPVDIIIAHAFGRSTCWVARNKARLGHPDEVETLRQLVGIGSERRPFGGGITIPLK